MCASARKFLLQKLSITIRYILLLDICMSTSTPSWGGGFNSRLLHVAQIKLHPLPREMTSHTHIYAKHKIQTYLRSKTFIPNFFQDCRYFTVYEKNDCRVQLLPSSGNSSHIQYSLASYSQPARRCELCSARRENMNPPGP